jgi:hypothetical protein
MEEKNKKNVIIGILIVIIILLVATIVVLALSKDKKLKPGNTTTTTTASVMNFEYDKKLTNELDDLYRPTESIIDKRLGLYKHLFVYEDEYHYYIRLQYSWGDASYQRMIDLHRIYGIMKEDGKSFKELFNDEKQYIIDFINEEVNKTDIFDYKYYLVESHDSVEIDNTYYAIYDKGWTKIYDLNANTGTGFTYKDTQQSVLKNHYYEIKDNKIFYFAQQDCKNHPNEVDLMSLTIENGKVKVEKEKTYDLDKEAIIGAGQGC